MKIVEKYKCDVCGTEYKDRKIIKQVHQPHNLNMSGYPLKIEVEMSDGTKLMYKRG